MALYEIAGLLVEMTVSGRTQKQAAAYAAPASGTPDIVLLSDPERILKYNPHLQTLDMAEYMSLGTSFAKRLLDFDGFQLHASAVVLEGKAYLFSAPPGTGKSTHTKKWCRLFGARHLNDDKPAVRCMNGVWTAYGTPWSGKNDLSSPEGAPIGAVVFLKRGDTNSIRKLQPAQAVPYLISQLLRYLTKEAMERQMELADLFLRDVPVWELTCRNDDEAAWVSHDAIIL